MHEKNDVKILVDYITFTIGFECFMYSVDEDTVIDLSDGGICNFICSTFGFGDLEFIMRRGFNGYDQSYIKDGITFCFGGCDTIMIQMSGTGCRLYESINPNLDWLELIKKIQSYSTHNISRLDIACDTFELLDMRKLIQFTLDQRYVSRFVDYLVGQGNKEESIIFGSPSSRFRLRIYNKTLERIRQLKTEENVPLGWIRLEFQLRDDAADSFITAWRATGNISTAYFGIMANQLRYVKKRDEKNPQRSVLIPWWRNFLGNADKIKLAYKGGLEYNFQSLQKYVFGQAGSSIRTWCEATDYDTQQLIEMVKHRKLNNRQENLLSTMGITKCNTNS